jgi:31-O-methyltransferase
MMVSVAHPPPTMEWMTLPNGHRVMQFHQAETALLYRDIFVDRCYARRELALRPGDVVVDAGANIGLASLFFHLSCPGVRIVAIEPAPAPCAALRVNVAEHCIDATIVECALSSENGIGTLTYYPRTPVMSSLYADADEDAGLTRLFLRNSGFAADDIEDIVRGKHEAVAAPCELRTLSKVLEQEDIEAVALLKLDVEKSELDVVTGIEERHWPLIERIVGEVHDCNGSATVLVSLLQERGFVVSLEQDPLLEGSGVYILSGMRA